MPRKTAEKETTRTVIEEISMQGYSEAYRHHLDDETLGAWESRKKYLDYFNDMMRRELNDLPIAV